ncbi:MAG: hypothetical protein KC466_04595 [Myxococcales bacterium]|nr:hypothetical protein [Myxococcales bacterium]
MAFVLADVGIAPAQVPAPLVAKRVEETIREGVRRNYEGDWEGAEKAFAALSVLDPTHPAAAFWPVTTAYWRTAEDSRDPADQARVTGALKRTVALAEARLAKDPDDAEMHFYRGQALAHWGLAVAEEGHLLRGARKSIEGTKALRRALELRPGYLEPNLPLGGHLYFLSLVPSVVKWFDWLWFIPEGDHDEGLRMIRACAEHCALLAQSAEGMLFQIHAFHEPGGHATALEIGRRLRRKFPDNAILQARWAQLLVDAGRLKEAVAETLDIERKARTRVRGYDAKIEALARIRRAQAELALGAAAGAKATLATFADGEPSHPRWGPHEVALARGEAEDLLGRRDAARAYYEQVLDLDEVPWHDGPIEAARRYLDEPFGLSGREARAP